jgi:hypothetical protein
MQPDFNWTQRRCNCTQLWFNYAQLGSSFTQFWLRCTQLKFASAQFFSDYGQFFALRAQAGKDARAPSGCHLVLVFAFGEDLLGSGEVR